jgi:hypothetical protein
VRNSAAERVEMEAGMGRETEGCIFRPPIGQLAGRNWSGRLCVPYSVIPESQGLARSETPIFEVRSQVPTPACGGTWLYDKDLGW